MPVSVTERPKKLVARNRCGRKRAPHFAPILLEAIILCNTAVLFGVMG